MYPNETNYCDSQTHLYRSLVFDQSEICELIVNPKIRPIRLCHSLCPYHIPQLQVGKRYAQQDQRLSANYNKREAKEEKTRSISFGRQNLN